jgi:hypothetical protein
VGWPNNPAKYTPGAGGTIFRRRKIRFLEDEISDSRKGVTIMCYNCGCGMPDDDMGNPKAIINKTFEEAAKGAEQTPEEAKKNTLELLKKVLKVK